MEDPSPEVLNFRRSAQRAWKIDDFQGVVSTYDQMNARGLCQALDFNQLAKAHIELKQFNRAKSYLKQAQELEPANTIFDQNLGIVYYNLGNLGKALEHLMISMNSHPNFNTSLYLSVVHLTLGDEKAAHPFIEKARSLSMRPERIEPILQDVRAGKKYVPPRSLVSRSVTLPNKQARPNSQSCPKPGEPVAIPENATTRFRNEAHLAWKKSDFEGVIDILGKMENAGLCNASDFNLRSRAHSKKNQYAQAKKDLDLALELEPANTVFHENLGILYYKMGEFIPAIEHLTTSVESHENFTTYQFLAMSYIRLGFDEQAMPYIEGGRTLTKNPEKFEQCLQNAREGKDWQESQERGSKSAPQPSHSNIELSDSVKVGMVKRIHRQNTKTVYTTQLPPSLNVQRVDVSNISLKGGAVISLARK